MKRTYFIVSALFLLILALAACGDGGENPGVSSGGDVNNAEYVFLAQSLRLPVPANVVGGTGTQNGRIYYHFVDGASSEYHVTVVSMLPDGTDVQSIAFPIQAQRVNVIALEITEAGNVAFLFREFFLDSGNTILHYKEYNLDGSQLFSQKTEEVRQGMFLEYALFAPDGNIVLLFRTLENWEAAVYVYNRSLIQINRLDVSWESLLSQTRDGRVVVTDVERGIHGTSHVLRELNTETGQWGEVHDFDIREVQGIYPARADSAFDLYVNTGLHLYGYTLETKHRVIFVNWLRTGIPMGNHYYVGFLSDGQIFTLESGEEHNRMITAFYLLTPFCAEYIAMREREVIVLGGFDLHSSDVVNQAARFNMQSHTHEISFMDFNETGDWNALLIDLTTGGGPDIFYAGGENWYNWLFDALRAQGIFADLYPFLDSDSVLNRRDFFPNILEAKENADGTLSMIANSFSINTMVTTRETAANLNAWTFFDMVELMEASARAGVDFPMGTDRAWSGIMFELLFLSPELINMECGESNLENEMFYTLLDLARYFPSSLTCDDIKYSNAFIEMLQGRQTFAEVILGPNWPDMPAVLMEEFTVLGIPTATRSVHTIAPRGAMGINAGSEHQEAAWSFIRKFLLPEYDTDLWFFFPLRIDTYDAVVQDLMTPRFHAGIDGEEIEVPHRHSAFGSFYAMTQEEANAMRAIVERADRIVRFDMHIVSIVYDEMGPFLAGRRSAEETARIMQNRVQTLLHERR